MRRATHLAAVRERVVPRTGTRLASAEPAIPLRQLAALGSAPLPGWRFCLQACALAREEAARKGAANNQQAALLMLQAAQAINAYGLAASVLHAGRMPRPDILPSADWAQWAGEALGLMRMAGPAASLPLSCS